MSSFMSCSSVSKSTKVQKLINMAGTFNVCDPHFAILLICYSLKVFYGFKSKENSSHKNYTGQTRVGQLL